jgi:hypothetical protein
MQELIRASTIEREERDRHGLGLRQIFESRVVCMEPESTTILRKAYISQLASNQEAEANRTTLSSMATHTTYE